MRGVVCARFRWRVNQFHVLIHLNATIVWGQSGQLADALHIVHQVGNAHGQPPHAVVCCVPRRTRFHLARVLRPSKRARGILRRDVRLALGRRHLTGSEFSDQRAASFEPFSDRGITYGDVIHRWN